MTTSTASERSHEASRDTVGAHAMADEAAVVLRAVHEGDLPFLRIVYASTREDELSATNWDDAQKGAFLAMQFDAQHRHYVEHYPGADFLIIEQLGRPIGRLYVDRGPYEIRLMDIALLPEHRGRGLGTRLIAMLLDEARAAGHVVRIHVEQFNPALRLYERLGFKRLEERGVYWLMEWMPEPAAAHVQESTAP